MLVLVVVSNYMLCLHTTQIDYGWVCLVFCMCILPTSITKDRGGGIMALESVVCPSLSKNSKIKPVALGWYSRITDKTESRKNIVAVGLK